MSSAADVDDRRRGDVFAIGRQARQCLPHVKGHALGAQMLYPRIEPLRTRGTVEHPVESLLS